MGDLIQCPSCGAAAPAEASSGARRCPACDAAIAGPVLEQKAATQPAASGGASSLTAVKIWLSVLLLAVAAYGGWTMWRWYSLSRRPDNHSEVLLEEVDFSVGRFELTERSGRKFNSGELAGQIWVASFFFASCPGPCAILNGQIAELASEMADEPVTFVSITVDPENDTPQKLGAYAESYIKRANIDPERWLFLTHAHGSEEVIGAICQSRFRVPFAKADHWMKLILVDQQGRVRGHYSATDTTELNRLKRKIQDLRKNPPAAKESEENAKTAGRAPEAKTDDAEKEAV